MRHGRTGVCPGWKSHAADRLESQLAQVLSERVSLPKGWEREVRKLLAKPAVAISDDALLAQRLLKALEALRKQHTWGDITDDRYRAEKREIERKLAHVEPRRDGRDG